MLILKCADIYLNTFFIIFLYSLELLYKRKKKQKHFFKNFLQIKSQR